MAQVLRQELRHRFGHGHRLVFQRFSDPSQPAINGGTNTDLGHVSNQSVLSGIDFYTFYVSHFCVLLQ
jgi:hypothetical protein